MKVFLNKIVIKLAVVAVLFSTVSCEEFLKEDPRGRVMQNMAFQQRDDLYGALYSMNQFIIWVSKAQLHTGAWIMGDDNTTHAASNKGEYRSFDVFTVSDAHAHMNSNDRQWDLNWRIIKAANFILNGADGTPGASQDEKDFVKRQANYWRAWAYFNLVRLWGPVPKLTTGDITWDVAPAKISEIFEVIVSDLQEAEKLPVNYTASPWVMNGMNVAVSEGAAKSTLAYVYLYMAGWPLEMGTEYYRMAAAKALEVIQASENGTYYYKLLPEYRLIHSREKNRSNEEFILANYHSSLSTGDNGTSFRATVGEVHQISGGNHNFRGEFGFYYDFPEGDRKEWTYSPVTWHTARQEALPWWHSEIPIWDRQPTSRKSLFTQWSTPYANDEWDIYASPEEQGIQWTEKTSPLITLAEVYCWYAEAVGRSNETTPLAIEVLNRVRNRANGSLVADRDIYPSTISPLDLAEAAYNERGWEGALWTYGNIAPRYSDMQRMKRVEAHYLKRIENPIYPHPFPDQMPPKTADDPDHYPDFREMFGPEEPWADTKMFLPYPSQDTEKNTSMVGVDKFQLIK